MSKYKIESYFNTADNELVLKLKDGDKNIMMKRIAKVPVNTYQARMIAVQLELKDKIQELLETS